MTSAEFCEQEIVCADFNVRSQVLVLGFSDGTLRLLSSVRLNTLQEIKDIGAIARMTCVNASASSQRFYAGYDSGLAKEFVLTGTVAAIRTFAPAVPSQIFEIEAKHTLVFLGYHDQAQKASGIFKCEMGKETPTLQFEFCGAHAEKVKVKEFRALDRGKELLALAESGKEFLLVDYTDGRTLAVLPVGVAAMRSVVSFRVLSNTKQLRSLYVKDVELSTMDEADDSLEGIVGDLLYLALDDGSVLTALLSTLLSGTKRIWCINVKDTYEMARVGPAGTPAEKPEIECTFVDPVTDRFLVGRKAGEIRVVQGSISKIINPKKKPAAENQSDKEAAKNS